MQTLEQMLRTELENQLTEQDIKEELQRIVDSNIDVIFQNGKFDYLVLRCTCDVILQITWDTLIGSQILNENELAGLKFQYKDKINKNQDKYDIEKLFDIENNNFDNEFILIEVKKGDELISIEPLSSIVSFNSKNLLPLCGV